MHALKFRDLDAQEEALAQRSALWRGSHTDGDPAA
jgi:hypothetical protein